MRLIITIIALALLSGCEGHYRYPCQNPANWGKTECNNEVCKAEGTCTSDVLAPAGTREFGLTNQTQSESESSEELSTESSETEISNTGCTDPNKLSYKDNNEDRVFNVKHQIEKPHGEAIVLDPEGDEYEPPVRTPPSMDEQPLTMNTVVDTAAHNAATK